MYYVGDFRTGKTVRGLFASNAIAGESITRATNGTVSVYKDGNTTQSTAGVTDTEDFDSLTGVHYVAIDTSADGTFYSAGSDFQVVLSAATIDGKTINAPLFQFSLENRSPLMPTTDGRKLDVSAGGEAGVDWANVGSPTTVVGLSSTTVKTATDVEADTQDIQSRLPAALTGGGNIKADALALSGDTVAADNAEAFFDGTGYAGTNNTIPTVTTVGTVNALANNSLTAAAAAADLTTELQAGLATQASVDDLPTNAELATALAAADDAVLSAISALNNLSQANIRTAVGLASANLDTQLDALPTNAELATALGTADDAILAAIAALNNLSSAQAQTAAAAALTAYDPPTNAEMEARTLVAASYATVAGLLAGVIEGAVTLKQSLQLANAANAGKLSGAATTSIAIRDLGDTKNRVAATVDVDGNRSAVTVSYD